MTIIVFLIDTSASMNQRTYLGISLLDVAKGAVETFIKLRSRDINSRWDRYMLLTFEDPPLNVKAGWKENHATLMAELKNLKAYGLSTLGNALKSTFDLLNVNRLNSGVDTYGQGRCPFYLEPAIIVCLTDGRHLTTTSGVQVELSIPMNNLLVGSELTKEPFRWDQRLFGVVLNIPAVHTPEAPVTQIPSAENAAIDAMADATGGRSYLITSRLTLNQCIESLTQKCQPGVVVQFEKIGPDPGDDVTDDRLKSMLGQQAQPWHSRRCLIYVPRSAQKGIAVGNWPIPESFWPDLQSAALPARSAHPSVKFSCTPCEPLILENLAFDKYELEPSPLTQYILERRQPNMAWQVFISNSAKYSDIGLTFGYLKASTNLQSVNLFVMPYNYPTLIPLLSELMKVHKMKPNQKWRSQFDNYLNSMPCYFALPLRRALAKMGINNLVPEHLDNSLSYSVMAHLKKVKNQAKVELERMIASVGQKVPAVDGIKIISRSQTSVLQRRDLMQLLDAYGGNTAAYLKQELNEFSAFTLGVPSSADIITRPYRNAYDVSRKNLLLQLQRMRSNLHTVLNTHGHMADEDALHSMPVQQMGNYQEYLKKMPASLRELESQPARLHTFGNPFKVNKNLMIDEADEAMPGQQAKSAQKRQADTPPPSPRPNKRKPGPLPRDVPMRQLLSPKHEVEYPPMSPSHTVISLGDVNHIDDDALSNKSDISDLTIDELVDSQTTLTNHSTGDRAQTANHVALGRGVSEAGSSVRELKTLVFKEVKRPGKNHERLFAYLNSLEGSAEERMQFFQEVTQLCLRFKRRILAQLVEQRMQQNMLHEHRDTTLVASGS